MPNPAMPQPESWPTAQDTHPDQPRFAVLDAPSILGLRPTGVERLPDALRAAGLVDRLHAVDAGRVAPPPYDHARDAATCMLNPRGIAHYAVQLADVLATILDKGLLPVVLGGDCSILLGSLLALRRRGRFGLLFLDGHADFYQPEAEPSGEAASMELALATGRGPALVTDLEGRRPLVRDADVVLFGRRDAEEAARYRSQPVPATIRTLELPQVRQLGIDGAAQDAVHHLARDELAGFWLHLDVDVLDDALMPAVDYHLPDGLAWDELTSVLHSAMTSGHAVGMEVTIFNPSLDRDGRLARRLADTLVASLHGPA